MAYTKTQWKDKVIEKPRTYTIQDNGDGTITLIPAEGTVYEPGTPVNAVNMNNLETQYDEAKADLDAHTAAADPHPQYAKDTDPPNAHASSHASGGSDPITPASIGAVNKAGDTMTGNLTLTGMNFPDKSNVDLNTIVTAGMYRTGNTNPNAPTGVAYGQLLVIRGSADTITQIITDYSSNYIYWRSGNPTEVGGNGTWKSWRKIWHEGNDGAGSGLDTDFFRGLAPDTAATANTIAERDAKGYLSGIATFGKFETNLAGYTSTDSIDYSSIGDYDGGRIYFNSSSNSGHYAVYNPILNTIYVGTQPTSTFGFTSQIVNVGSYIYIAVPYSATAFKIYRAPAAGGAWTAIATSANVTYASTAIYCTGLASDGTYLYIYTLASDGSSSPNISMAVHKMLLSTSVITTNLYATNAGYTLSSVDDAYMWYDNGYLYYSPDNEYDVYKYNISTASLNILEYDSNYITAPKKSTGGYIYFKDYAQTIKKNGSDEYYVGVADGIKFGSKIYFIYNILSTTHGVAYIYSKEI